MNFESYAFKNMDSDSLYEYVRQHIVPDKRMYLFFDEVQRVPDWRMRLILFVSILTVIFMSRVPMHICCLLNMLLICPEDV